MSNLVHSIEHIFNSTKGYLKNEGMQFYNIPAYQRGYKWSSNEVNKLLNDIDKFQADGDKFYCLQNITIVPKENYFNVVDGQQRLTTLVVLLSFLQKQDLVKNKINYAVRQSTQQFITDNIINQEIDRSIQNSDLISSWEAFKTQNINHQDIFYLFSTAYTIRKWFSGKEDGFINSFTDKLLNDVKLIVNKVKDGNEEKIFGNLNSKRIPLDGADLVRAILITRVANEEGEKVGDVKNIVRVNERRVRIGWEIDEINNWWNRIEVKNYFQFFSTIKSEKNGNDFVFKADKYPLNYLLLLFAEANGEKELTLDFIETDTQKNKDTNKSALEFYKRLIRFHYTLKDWFQDREIYHYLGFLFAQFKSEMKFKTVWTQWNNFSDRNQFKTFLKGEIKVNIFKADTINTIFSETGNWYYENPNKLVKILLILDVIKILKLDNAILPVKAFQKIGNDIEHIFPQTPKEVKDKKGYIIYLNKYVLGKPNKVILKALSDFETNLYNEKYQKKLDDFINKQIGEIKVNSIGNLVLLDYSLNRSLKNAPYSIKRARVIEHFNSGEYIQPHTFQVFARYFVGENDESLDLAYWSKDDIESNETKIKQELNDYFSEKPNGQ